MSNITNISYKNGSSFDVIDGEYVIGGGGACVKSRCVYETIVDKDYVKCNQRGDAYFDNSHTDVDFLKSNKKGYNFLVVRYYSNWGFQYFYVPKNIRIHLTKGFICHSISDKIKMDKNIVKVFHSQIGINNCEMENGFDIARRQEATYILENNRFVFYED